MGEVVMMMMTRDKMRRRIHKLKDEKEEEQEIRIFYIFFVHIAFASIQSEASLSRCRHFIRQHIHTLCVYVRFGLRAGL